MTTVVPHSDRADSVQLLKENVNMCEFFMCTGIGLILAIG